MLNFRLSQYRLIHHLTQKNCTRCNTKCDVTYFCEHTEQKDMCTECYQYIHWSGTFDMMKEETKGINEV